MTVAAGAAVAPSGAARLRRWDVPYSEAKPPASTRPVRPSPRDRGKLIQRSRLIQQQTTWNNTGSVDAKISALTLDELVTGQPDSGIVLNSELTDRFYGGLKGSTVEDELLRLGTLVKGLLRDFTVVKDTLFRSEDAFSVQNERIDILESESEKMVARVDQLASSHEAGQVDELDARLLAHQEEVDRRLNSLGAVDAPLLIPLTPLVDTMDRALAARPHAGVQTDEFDVATSRPSTTMRERCCESVDISTTRAPSATSADGPSSGALVLAMRKELDDLASRVKAIDSQVARQQQSSSCMVESPQSGLLSVTASAIVDRALAETVVTPVPPECASLLVSPSPGLLSEGASPRDVDLQNSVEFPAIGSRSVSPLLTAAADSIVDSLLTDAVCRPLGQRPRTAPPHQAEMSVGRRPHSAPSAQQRPTSAGRQPRPLSAGRINFASVPEDEGYIHEDTAEDGVDDDLLFANGGSASCDLGARHDDSTCLHWISCEHRPQSAPTYSTRSLDVRSPAEIIRGALEEAAQRGDLAAWLEDLAMADAFDDADAPRN